MGHFFKYSLQFWSQLLEHFPLDFQKCKKYLPIGSYIQSLTLNLIGLLTMIVCSIETTPNTYNYISWKFRSSTHCTFMLFLNMILIFCHLTFYIYVVGHTVSPSFLSQPTVATRPRHPHRFTMPSVPSEMVFTCTSDAITCRFH